MMAVEAIEKKSVPKYVKLREQLRVMISQMEPGQALPTVMQIRNKYRISQPTVDRAIQELRSEGMLVTRRGSGIYVSEMAKTKRIGVLFYDDIFDTIQPGFYRRLLAILRDNCYSSNKLLTYYINDNYYDVKKHGPDRLQLDVDTGQLDGLLAISVPAMSHDKYWNNLISLGVPFEVLTHTDCPQRVCGDHLAVIRLGVEALVRQGCRRLALWHTDTIDDGFYSGVSSFYEAVACSAASTSPEWIVQANLTKPFEMTGYRQFRQLWETWDEKPDGIICFDDHYTIGLLHAMEDMNIKVPQELKIATLANKGEPEPLASRVTRIEFDAQEVASVMMERLEQRMAGKTPEPEILRVQPHLCELTG